MPKEIPRNERQPSRLLGQDAQQQGAETEDRYGPPPDEVETQVVTEDGYVDGDGRMYLKTPVQGEDRWERADYARKGRMREQDYRRKTQELAEQRKMMEAQMPNQNKSNGQEASGQSGAQQGFAGQPTQGQPFVAGGGQMNGGEQPNEGPTDLDPGLPDEMPDPLDDPDAAKDAMDKMAQFTKRMWQENQNLKQQVGMISNRFQQQEWEERRDAAHQELEQTIPGYDREAVENAIQQQFGNQPQKLQQWRTLEGYLKAHQLMQNDSQAAPAPQNGQGQGQPSGQPTQQRQTPYSESSRGSAPTPQQDGASFKPAFSKRQIQENYMQADEAQLQDQPPE